MGGFLSQGSIPRGNEFLKIYGDAGYQEPTRFSCGFSKIIFMPISALDLWRNDILEERLSVIRNSCSISQTLNDVYLAICDLYPDWFDSNIGKLGTNLAVFQPF